MFDNVTKYNYNIKKIKGFTLVELIIVVFVIAILASILIPTFSSIIEKAKDANDKIQANEILKKYYTDSILENKQLNDKIIIVLRDGQADSKYYLINDGQIETLDKTPNYDQYDIVINENGIIKDSNEYVPPYFSKGDYKLNVVHSISELEFNPGYMFNNDQKFITQFTCATTMTNILKVSGGETIYLTQNIPNKIIEFSIAELGVNWNYFAPYGHVPNEKINDNSITLTNDTRYVIINFFSNEVFSSDELRILNSCIIIDK